MLANRTGKKLCILDYTLLIDTNPRATDRNQISNRAPKNPEVSSRKEIEKSPK